MNYFKNMNKKYYRQYLKDNYLNFFKRIKNKL